MMDNWALCDARCVCLSGVIYDVQGHMGGTWTANDQILRLTSCWREALYSDSNLKLLYLVSWKLPKQTHSYVRCYLDIYLEIGLYQSRGGGPESAFQLVT